MKTNKNMKTMVAGALFSIASSAMLNAQVIISGYLANPAGTDSPYEYVQMVATENIDFSATPMAVVFANNGTATANGWINGGSLTYEMSLTSGTVSAGQSFYVGGSGKLLNGAGGTDISGLNWIRTINTGTTAGDLFGSANSAGVVGNGGGNADGIGIFNSLTLTASSVPMDAVFYGSAVGSAFVSSSSGYTVPINDLYSGGYLQANSTVMSDPGSAQYTVLSGVYDTNTSAWITGRTSSLVTLPTTSDPSTIASQINLSAAPAPEPTSLALAGLGLVAIGIVRRNRKA